MSKKNIPLESVILKDEDIYWQGHPEKIPFILNDVRSYIVELLLRIILDVILIPMLLIETHLFNPFITVVIFILWGIHCKKCIDLIMDPFIKLSEWKNIYYIITNNHIYIQFGSGDQIFYRMYPIDRIGTKVFFRKNAIDTIFGVGTIGISVDDYYEERLISIKGFEDVYQIFKGFTGIKKAQLEEEEEKRKIEEEKERERLAEQLKREEERQRREEERLRRELDMRKERMFAEEEQDPMYNESYSEYKRRNQESVASRYEEERRRLESKHRAEKAKLHNEMQNAMLREDAERERMEKEKQIMKDIEQAKAMDEIMQMQEEHLNNTPEVEPSKKLKPNPSMPKSNMGSRRKRPNYKYSVSNKKPKEENTIQKSEIKNDGNEPGEVPETVSEEELQNLDLSAFWKNDHKKKM